MPKFRQFSPVLLGMTWLKMRKNVFSLSKSTAILKICSRNPVTVGLRSAALFCTLHQTVPSDNYWSKLLMIPASFISFPRLLLTTTAALLILLCV